LRCGASGILKTKAGIRGDASDSCLGSVSLRRFWEKNYPNFESAFGIPKEAFLLKTRTTKNKKILFACIFWGVLFLGFFWVPLLFPEKSQGAFLGEEEKPQIWVVNPWIYHVASFIGGEEVSVHPLLDWEGQALFSEKNFIPPGGFVLALDQKEADKIPLAYELQNFRSLFRDIPVLRGKTNPMYLDPPTMSLLGQKVLITLASLFPQHYIYFQRNLAEFESRLESTVDIGRKMLHPVGIVNFSGSYALWIRAASLQEIRPSPEKMSRILKEEGNLLLGQTLETSLEKGHVVVTDESMPLEIQEIVKQQRNGIVLLLPPLLEDSGDFFLFLYEQYLAILNRHNQLQRKS
jgi:hypothetical protein